MGVGMTKVLHVKIPMTDLQRSADWYAQLMDRADNAATQATCVGW